MLEFKAVLLKMKVKNFGSLKLEIYNNYQELSKRAAEIFLQACQDTLKTKDIFSVSLSGGKTPKGLFELLSRRFRKTVPWTSIHIFWTDERARKEDPESNFYLAWNIWLKDIVNKIPEFKKNIHRIKMEMGIVKGAKEYEKEINKFAPEGFGLSFHGIGSDGHRNGIFPDNQKINWKNRIWDLPKKRMVYGYKLPPEVNPFTQRITLTPWFLNKSKNNILMVSGGKKAKVLKKIIGKKNYNFRNLPAITFRDTNVIILTTKSTFSKI